MKTYTISIITTLILLGSSLPSIAQSSQTPVIQHNDHSVSIHELSWLTGFWGGNGMGGYNEEFWSTPVDDKMIGIYRHIKNGKVIFYEILTILIDKKEGMVLRLKHFNPDLTGWEKKDQYQEFKLIHIEPDKIVFEGLFFQLVADDSLLITVDFEREGGTVVTETFRLQKKNM